MGWWGLSCARQRGKMTIVENVISHKKGGDIFTPWKVDSGHSLSHTQHINMQVDENEVTATKGM